RRRTSRRAARGASSGTERDTHAGLVCGGRGRVARRGGAGVTHPLTAADSIADPALDRRTSVTCLFWGRLTPVLAWHVRRGVSVSRRPLGPYRNCVQRPLASPEIGMLLFDRSSRFDPRRRSSWLLLRARGTTDGSRVASTG